MTLIVPRLTSQIRAENISSGRITHAKMSGPTENSTIALLSLFVTLFAIKADNVCGESRFDGPG